MRKCVLIAGVLLLAAARLPASPVADDAPTRYSRWTVIDGAAVHYVDTAPGSDLPVLLLIPGFLGATEVFLPVADILARELRVVIPDLPGFGWSEAPAGGCTMEDRLAFVEAFSDLVVPGSFHLAGASLGANIAIRFAVAQPERVRRLVLLSPFGLERQHGVVERLERYDALFPILGPFIGRGFLKRELEQQVCDPSELSQDIMDSYYRPFRTAAGRWVVIEVTRHILCTCFFDEYLPLVSQPTLVLAGSDDVFRSQDALEVLKARLPSCTAVLFEGCRHHIQLDAPAKVADLILWFLAADS
jgi:pimeloyl-ACP methyl ester carboxylesterase